MTSGTMPWAMQGAHDADMGKAARGAAAERKPDGRARGGRFHRRSGGFGGTVAVARTREKPFEHQNRLSSGPGLMIEPGQLRNNHYSSIW